jgi:soluble lytic murein transglycosylase-like protein
VSKRFSAQVEAAIQAAAKQHGIDPGILRAYVAIESGGNPNAVTGSYKGLLQLSDKEFARHGGGDIFNIGDNINAGTVKLRAEMADFERRHGRKPSAADLYMVHQQGPAGYAAHMARPDAPAWQNMLSTGEGRAKGEKWAKLAIWGNVPERYKQQFGSVDNLTSAQFTKMWADRVARGMGGGSQAPATEDHVRFAAPALAEAARATAANAPGADGLDKIGMHLLTERASQQPQQQLDQAGMNALAERVSAGENPISATVPGTLVGPQASDTPTNAAILGALKGSDYQGAVGAALGALGRSLGKQESFRFRPLAERVAPVTAQVSLAGSAPVGHLLRKG